MAYNMIKTIAGSKGVEAPIPVTGRTGAAAHA
jgi:hypothetical protein